MKQAVQVISFDDRVHIAATTTGRIRSVLLDRSRRTLQALVLRRGLRRSDLLLPADQIRFAAPADGSSQITTAQPEALLPLPAVYSHADLCATLIHRAAAPQPPPKTMAWPCMNEDLVLLRQNQPVFGPDGPVGRLRQIVVHWPGSELVALVVRTGRLRRRSVRIAATSVVGWAGDRVHIDLERAALQELPTYRPDRAIHAAVCRALQQDEAIRRTDAGMIGVEVSDGCVTLSGHLADGRNSDRAARLARQVQGARHVTNDLIADAQLTHAVAQALALVDQASRASVGFSVKHGAVVVFGTVTDTHARQAVETAVADVPGIRMLINQVRSPDTPHTAVPQRMLQPRRGQSVFARDGFVGRVEHVVIEPRLRQATAIVVDAHPQVEVGDWLGDAPCRRMLVLPLEVVESLSPADVFLKFDRQTAALAEAFSPGSYLAPPAGWRPPFPYAQDEAVVSSRYWAGPMV